MKRGLVMEGGAMRGLFTAGVIDVFMESGIEFDGAIGVSAGACFGCTIKRSSRAGRFATISASAGTRATAACERFCAPATYTARSSATTPFPRCSTPSTTRCSRGTRWSSGWSAPMWRRASRCTIGCPTCLPRLDLSARELPLPGLVLPLRSATDQHPLARSDHRRHDLDHHHLPLRPHYRSRRAQRQASCAARLAAL